MNRLCSYYLIFVALFVAAGGLSSQENLQLSTQTDVDIYPLFCESCDTVSFITINNADGLISNLDSLYPIEVIDGALLLGAGAKAIDYSGLHQVHTVTNSIAVLNFSDVDTLRGWPLLTDMSRAEIRLRDFSRVQWVTGFDHIRSLRGLVLDSPAMVSFDAFKGLTSLGRIRTFGAILEEIVVSDSITKLNQLWMANCPVLSHVSVLPHLDSIGRFQIRRTPLINDELFNMSLRVVSELDLREQPGITDLSWLSTLESMSALKLLEMPDLVSIEDIRVPVDSLYDIQIVGNPNLSACQTDWLCLYLRDSLGTFEIADNSPGCNSREEILDQCVFTDTDEVGGTQELKVYPNPTQGRVQVDVDCPDCRYEVIDAAGRVIRSGKMSSPDIDLTMVPAGAYHLYLFDDSGGAWSGQVVRE